MSYCSYCGNLLDDNDAYCRKCGKGAHTHQTFGERNAEYSARVQQREPLNKLCCELAYIGTLFWVPLLICPDEKDSKYHANQGLWVLILTVLSCTGIRVLSMVNDWLAGGAVGIIFSGVYSLAFMAFLFFMIYLLWNVIAKAMAVHHDKEPRTILFFDQLPIIK